MAASQKKPTLSQFQRAFVTRHLSKVQQIAKDQGTVITRKGQAAAKAAVERTLLAQNRRK